MRPAWFLLSFKSLIKLNQLNLNEKVLVLLRGQITSSCDSNVFILPPFYTEMSMQIGTLIVFSISNSKYLFHSSLDKLHIDVAILWLNIVL